MIKMKVWKNADRCWYPLSREKERQDRIQLAERIINDVGTLHERLKTMHDQFIQKDKLPDSVRTGLSLVRTKHEELCQMSAKGFGDQDIPKMTETLKLCLNAYEFLKKEYGMFYIKVFISYQKYFKLSVCVRIRWYGK